MLILGSKYKFTELELNTLKKKFKKITHIKYADKPEDGVLKEIKEHVDKEKFDVIVLNTRAKVGDNIIRYLTRLQFKKRNKRIKIIAIENFMEEYLKKCYIPESHEDLKFLEQIQPFSKTTYILKRFIDYTGILIIFLITWPIMVYARYKIKEQSPGTSIFRQLRVGQNNKEFKCVKFRSMYLDAEKNGAQFASKNDPRVFKWGETMRKYRIDELPQILNVLKGDMHLIGPRPERKFWINQFEKAIPYYSERHLVKPGVTGWAQVMYPYGANVEDARQKLMYDLYYIKNWSIWLE
ncbi:sugar transferase, partial [Campylobacter sp.]|uniref:sugar transferase n=1 Tax=Campylobacter sp. TaxID=205 RepID=UPI002705402C|nr:sugar transferase [Campylobacter sp.]